MSDFSDVNKLNVQAVRRGIALKERSEPWLPTVSDTEGVVTDYDHFPYGRYFRGQYNAVAPIVAEREAGWRQREDDCYELQQPRCEVDDSYPNHCFQVPCSTIFPCYPKFQAKYDSRDALLVSINKSCIPQYR